MKTAPMLTTCFLFFLTLGTHAPLGDRACQKGVHPFTTRARRVRFEQPFYPCWGSTARAVTGRRRPREGLTSRLFRTTAPPDLSAKRGSGCASTSMAASCRRRIARSQLARSSTCSRNGSSRHSSRQTAAKIFDPGRVTIRRLNRSEYNNTIRDLIGIDFHPADDFPSDDVGYGFDNIGDVLSMPPILMEKYLAAAETISEEAIIVEPSAKGLVKTWNSENMGSARAVGPGETGRSASARRGKSV